MKKWNYCNPFLERRTSLFLQLNLCPPVSKCFPSFCPRNCEFGSLVPCYCKLAHPWGYVKMCTIFTQPLACSRPLLSEVQHGFWEQLAVKSLSLSLGFMVSFLKLTESRAMLCLEGGLLIEKYMEVWVMRRQWQLRKSLEITPNHSSPVFFPCQGLGATDPGCWECCCILELCCCSTWVCPSTHPDNFPAWKVTTHKYKAASLGRRIPRAAVLALHIKSSSAGRR